MEKLLIITSVSSELHCPVAPPSLGKQGIPWVHYIVLDGPGERLVLLCNLIIVWLLPVLCSPLPFFGGRDFPWVHNMEPGACMSTNLLGVVQELQNLLVITII